VWRVGFHAEALSFHFDDAALGLYLVSDVLGDLQAGYVDGVWAVVLQVAAADVLVEQDRLGGEDLEHALVYGVLGEQAVHVADQDRGRAARR
jgi:hypothetical protein